MHKNKTIMSREQIIAASQTQEELAQQQHWLTETLSESNVNSKWNTSKKYTMMQCQN